MTQRLNSSVIKVQICINWAAAASCVSCVNLNLSLSLNLALACRSSSGLLSLTFYSYLILWQMSNWQTLNSSHQRQSDGLHTRLQASNCSAKTAFIRQRDVAQASGFWRGVQFEYQQHSCITQRLRVANSRMEAEQLNVSAVSLSTINLTPGRRRLTTRTKTHCFDKPHTPINDPI